MQTQHAKQSQLKIYLSDLHCDWIKIAASATVNHKIISQYNKNK